MKIKKLLLLLLMFSSSLFILTSCDFINKINCDHEYVTIVHDPTCMNKGYTEDLCSKCGNSKKYNYVDALGHDLEETVIKEATCTEEGESSYKCKRCGVETGKTTTDALGHDYVDSAISATCTEAGKIKHTCSRCGDCYETETEALGHDFHDVTTYDEDGNMVISHVCTFCSYTDPDVTTIDFNGSALYGLKTDTANFENGTDLYNFYMGIVNICTEFNSSKDDVTPETIHMSDGAGGTKDVDYYVIGTLNPSEYNLTYTEATLCWKLVTLDNPAYYWLSKEVLYTTDNKTFKITIYADYKDYSTRQTINTGITNMLVSAATYISDSMSDYKKAKALHDFLVTNIDYAYKSDGTTPEDSNWAHNMVGAILYQKGVCECYSKVYCYLCNIFGVECIFVSGNGTSGGSTGPHAWNYIKISDKWYAVDSTWDDGGGKDYNHDYFAIGSNTIDKNHTVTISTEISMDYLYALPTLSKTSYSSFLG